MKRKEDNEGIEGKKCEREYKWRPEERGWLVLLLAKQ